MLYRVGGGGQCCTGWEERGSYIPEVYYWVLYAISGYLPGYTPWLHPVHTHPLVSVMHAGSVVRCQLHPSQALSLDLTVGNSSLGHLFALSC